MISSREKQRLMAQYRDDPQMKRAAVFKSAAGLAVVALIAVSGMQSDLVTSAEKPRHEPASVQVPARGAALADAQQKMDERRSRFDRRPASSASIAPVKDAAARGIEPRREFDEVTMLRHASD